MSPATPGTSYEIVIDGVIGRIPLRTPTLPPATHTNAWILGEQRVTVVDPASPWAPEQQELLHSLEQLTVERIVLTHHHPDHVGAAAFLREKTGAPILAHPQTACRVDFAVDGHLAHDELLDTDTGRWQLDFTPGHAPGHLALWHEETGTLVGGDMVAAVGTIVLAPPEGDLALYLDSLTRLRDRSPARICPAHGGVIVEAVGKLQEYIDHRHMRTGQVRQALAARPGASAPMDLVPTIYPELPEAFHGIAALQVQCHLEWLEDRGEVCREGGDEPPRYRMEQP